MYVHISNKVSGLIRFIFETLIFHDTATIRLQVYTFGVESFTGGWIREQCNLTTRFPNVFVQGLNLAKNRPTSLIWTEYTWSSKKNNLFKYLIKKMFTYSYTVIWFLYNLFAVSKQSLHINITFWVSELNIWAIKDEYFQTGMSEIKTILISMMKNWVSHILFHRKRGLNIYLASLKKGAIGTTHPYYVI